MQVPIIYNFIYLYISLTDYCIKNCIKPCSEFRIECQHAMLATPIIPTLSQNK